MNNRRITERQEENEIVEYDPRIGQYVTYAPNEIVSTPKHRSVLVYVVCAVLGLWAFGQVGLELGYLTGMAIQFAIPCIVGLYVWYQTKDIWKSLFVGTAVIATMNTNVSENIMYHALGIAYSLQRIASTAIVVIVVLVVLSLFRKR